MKESDSKFARFDLFGLWGQFEQMRQHHSMSAVFVVGLYLAVAVKTLGWIYKLCFRFLRKGMFFLYFNSVIFFSSIHLGQFCMWWHVPDDNGNNVFFPVHMYHNHGLVLRIWHM